MEIHTYKKSLLCGRDFLYVSLSAAGCVIVFLKPRREKFVGGKFDVFKDLAGIVRGGDTFFSGYAEIICGDEHLYPALKLYDGEKPESHKDLSVAAGGDSAAENFAYALREIDLRLAAFAVAGVGKPGVKYNGRHGLDNGSRGIGRSPAVLKGVLGSENLHVSFAAIENDLFGEKGDSRNGVRRRNRSIISGEIYEEVEGHIYGIKASVKGYGLHLEKNVKYLYIFCFNAERAVYFFLVTSGKIYRKVF